MGDTTMVEPTLAPSVFKLKEELEGNTTAQVTKAWIILYNHYLIQNFDSP